jgi:radical SAM protein with 4Fe4S-binding SPASM domain
MDKFRIDSHKLLFHPRRVADFLEGVDIAPIYMEISPFGGCNHRCVFCGLDFMGYVPKKLDTAVLRERLTELGQMGLKSIMYAGEGEPYLHKDLPDIITHAKACGIDNAVTTNGVLMRAAVLERHLPATSWIKVSCNAGSPETYAKVHGTKPADFGRVLENLEAAVALRRRLGADCTLGAQMLLLPENAHEVESLARTLRDIGLDYLVVKPYSQHPQSHCDQYKDISYAGYEDLAERVCALSTDAFDVVFRLGTMRKWDDKRHAYSRCLALPFWSYLDASGNIWGCSVYLGDERFLYGNIYEQTFAAIWHGERRRESMRYCREHLDASACRVNCRMDEINRYLWELVNPGSHVNFI